jgi:Domain of unknown function (DUF4105)
MTPMQLVCKGSGFRAAFFSCARRLACWLVLHLCCGLGGAWAQGLAAPTTSVLTAQAERLGLHQNPTWHALLQLKNGQPQILDDGFLLSLPAFSPQRELDATLAALQGADAQQALCRFPARALWLHQALGLPPRSTAHCAALAEFRERAPADRISLVFASENLSQPSSMMGHLFLKVAGQRADGTDVAHAISFFTDAASFNLPKLFYESMVVGKQGFFVLTPYHDEVRLYAVDEQRSLWEYELQLDAFTRDLMQAHMHELRQTRITYFFQDYNCATLVQHILAIAAPQMLNGGGWWTTPKGVVQRAQAADLVASSTVQTPSRWRVRSLRDALPPDAANDVRAWVDQRQPPPERGPLAPAEGTQGYLQLELARAYNAHLLETQRIDTADWRRYAAQVDALQQRRYPGLALQADAQKSPANAPPDRQVSIGWQHLGGRNHLRLGLQPVSHTLADDNRHLFSESELRLFDSAWRVDVQTGAVRLDHFTLYAVESLLPRDAMTGGLSGRFKIGIESQPQLQRPGRNAALIEGAGGYTWRLSDDVDAFALVGGGWGLRQSGYFYAMPTVGLVVREVFDMKTVLRLSEVTRPLGQREASRELTVTQSKYLDRHHSLVLTWRRVWQDGRAANDGQVMLKRLF